MTPSSWAELGLLTRSPRQLESPQLVGSFCDVASCCCSCIIWLRFVERDQNLLCTLSTPDAKPPEKAQTRQRRGTFRHVQMTRRSPGILHHLSIGSPRTYTRYTITGHRESSWVLVCGLEIQSIQLKPLNAN